MRNAKGEVNLTHSVKCRELNKDFELVSMEDLTSSKGSAGERTHASDCVGYYVHYEFPLQNNLSKFQ